MFYAVVAVMRVCMYMPGTMNVHVSYIAPWSVREFELRSVRHVVASRGFSGFDFP